MFWHLVRFAKTVPRIRTSIWTIVVSSISYILSTSWSQIRHRGNSQKGWENLPVIRPIHIRVRWVFVHHILQVFVIHWTVGDIDGVNIALVTAFQIFYCVNYFVSQYSRWIPRFDQMITMAVVGLRVFDPVGALRSDLSLMNRVHPHGSKRTLNYSPWRSMMFFLYSISHLPIPVDSNFNTFKFSGNWVGFTRLKRRLTWPSLSSRFLPTLNHVGGFIADKDY